MASTQGIRAGRAFVELFADNSKLVAGLRSAESKVKAFGASVQSVGLLLAKIGTAAMTPFVASAKAFGDFEQNMKMISTMLGKPAEFMGQFSTGIRNMAKEFGESIAVLSKGMYDLLSSSVNPAGAMAVLRDAVKSAKGGFTDTTTAVKGLMAILNSYQLSAKYSSRITDIMFQTVNRGVLTFEDLANTIGMVTPMARAAKMPVETMAAAVATLTRQIPDASEAVTRLVNVIKQAPQAAGDLVGLVSKYVGKSLEEIQIDFPEIRAASGIAALSADINGLIFDMNLMRNSTGASDEAFQKMTGGLNYEFNKLWATIKDIAISVGEALAPEIKKVAEWLSVAGNGFSEWISQNKQLVITLALATVGITAFGFALIALGTVIGATATIIGVFASMIAFLVSPIGLVISGLALMAGAILSYTNAGGQAIQWLGGTFDFLRQDAEIAFNGIADALAAGNIAQAAKVLWLTLKLEWTRGVTYIQNLWAKFIGFLGKVAIGGFTVIATTANIVVFGMEAALVATANTFKRVWGSAADWVAKRLIDIRGLVDGTFDTTAAKASIDADAAARNKQMEADFADVGKRFNQGLKESGDWNIQMRANIDDMTGADISENEKALTEAIRERDNAVNQAREMRNAAYTKPQDFPTSDVQLPGMPMMPQIEIPDIGNMIKQEAIKIGTRGTFSAFAAFGFGVGTGVEERTAKASEETAKNTRQMMKDVRELKDNQLEFA